MLNTKWPEPIGFQQLHTYILYLLFFPITMKLVCFWHGYYAYNSPNQLFVVAENQIIIFNGSKSAPCNRLNDFMWIQYTKSDYCVSSLYPSPLSMHFFLSFTFYSIVVWIVQFNLIPIHNSTFPEGVNN